MATPKHKSLADALKIFTRYALKMDEMKPAEQALVMSLLLRHCQARLGLKMEAPRQGPLPENPEDSVAFFRKLATQLEAMSGEDNTLIVNLLLQSWQRRAAIALEEIKATVQAQVPEESRIVH